MWEDLNLSQIAERVRCLKGPAYHNYTDAYEACVKPWRNQEVKLFEIGVFHGESMRIMWKTYFSIAHIYGLDVDPVCSLHADERVHVTIGDQGNADLMRRIADNLSPIQFMVDDGSHHPKDMITSLNVLAPYIPVGGFYFLEDINHHIREEIRAFVSDLLVKDPGLSLIKYERSRRTSEDVAILTRTSPKV